MQDFTIERIINQYKDYDLGTVVVELNRESERLERIKPEVNMADRPLYTAYQKEIKHLLHLLQTGKISHSLDPGSLEKIRPVVDSLIARGHLPAEFSAISG